MFALCIWSNDILYKEDSIQYSEGLLDEDEKAVRSEELHCLKIQCTLGSKRGFSCDSSAK